MSSKFTCLFSSCEQYSFLWNDFFKLFSQNSNIHESCNFVSNVEKDMVFFGYNIKGIGKYKDASWGTRTIKAVKQIKTNYILFLLDDLFLLSKNDIQYIDKALDILDSNSNIGAIVIKDFKDCSNYPLYNDDFFIQPKWIEYYITTQIVLWRKDYLLKVLRKGESIWVFETLGTYRAWHYPEIILYNKFCEKCFNIPIGGVWDKGHVRKEYKNLLNNFPAINENNTIRIKPKPKNGFTMFFRSLYMHFYMRTMIKFRCFPYKEI